MPNRRRAVWAPSMVSSSPREDTDLEREIDAIVKLLKDKGPLPSPEIRRELETRFWGPGRLRQALVEARRRGLVRRSGRRSFEAAD
ncbi:MAG TPA: crosslink repair DNA glycosylase YcaQ family protein [Thermoleophilaceae bacterium]|nr:crosslink repair DNA glycosylase YcaQ family protein [Thermoleophilaceae bacterium]